MRYLGRFMDFGFVLIDKTIKSSRVSKLPMQGWHEGWLVGQISSSHEQNVTDLAQPTGSAPDYHFRYRSTNLL